MNIFNIKFNKTFYRFLFAFLIVITLSLLSYIFFYRSSYTIIKDGLIGVGLQDVERFAHDMDRNLYDIHKLIYYSKNETSLMQLDTKKSIESYDYLTLQRYIAKSLAVTPFIDDMFFYVKNNDAIISQEGSFQFDNFFDTIMKSDIKNKYYWRDYFKKTDKISITSKEVVLPQETYYTQLISEGNNARELTIIVADSSTFKNMRMVILLNSRKIAELYGVKSIIFAGESGDLIFGDKEAKNNITTLMKNTKGTQLQNHDALKLDNIDSYAFTKRSQYYDWYYLKLIPYSQIFDKLDQYNKIALFILLVLLVFSIGLAYIFSLNLYKPIKRLMDLTEDAFNDQQALHQNENEIQKIYNHIKLIYQNYETIEHRYNAMQGIYRQYFYEKLIKNMDTPQDGLTENLLNINQKDFENFIVINYSINFDTDLSSALPQFKTNDIGKLQLAVRELVNLSIEKLGYMYYSFQVDTNSHLTIVTLNGEQFDMNIFENTVRDILKNDSEYFSVNFSISSVYHGLNQLRMAYDDASNLINYHTLKNETQFLFHGSIKVPWEHMMPKKLMERARNLVELSKVEDLGNCMHEALDYFEEKSTPVLYIRKSLAAIFSNILQNAANNNTLDSEKVDYIYKNIEICATKSGFKNLIDIIIELCNCIMIQEKEAGGGHSTIEKMAQYIDVNYAENISLDFFADKYKMSPIYLSKIFKEFKGVNFSDYVNKVRMENARQLLLGSDLKIKELSVKSGYNDPNTFIKVFKKYFGVAPGEYRKMNISNE